MANCRSRLRFSRLFSATIFAASCLSFPNQASAEVVLDEFDVPAIAISPEMENELIVTESVGFLNATRQISTGGGATDPISQIDSAISSPSMLTAELHGHSRTSSLTPRISFVFRYEFAIFDATEAGTNDAIFLDFESFAGTEQPLFLRCLATELSHPNEFFEIHAPVPVESGPTTIMLPFSAFNFRASNDGSADFSTLTSLNFSFLFFGPNDDVQWSMQLDRVRFGTIPEPSTAYLSLLTTIALVSRRMSPFRVSRVTNRVGGGVRWLEESTF
jgi:hypothetical protein